MWKSWKRSCSWTAPLTWMSSLPTPLMKIWQGLPLGLGTKRPSRIWVEDKKHAYMHAHTCAQTLMCTRLWWGSQGCVEGRIASSVCRFLYINTSCVFLYGLQVELSWIPPFMARLVTLTPWSTRSVTVSVFTMCFEAYRRSNRATTRVWRLSPRWKLEICVQTPTPLQSTKAATIPIPAMKLVGAETLRTHLSTTTWVTQVSHKQKVHAFPWISRIPFNHMYYLQMTPAQTPSPWTRWRGCIVTWTSSTRPGNLCPNLLRYRCHHKWWSSIIIPSAWNGFIPSRDTFTTGETSCICLRERTKRNHRQLAAPWNVAQPTWHTFGLYLSCLLCLSVGFLEKWDQCVINALRGGFCSSMPPIPPPPGPAPLLDTGPLERLKVW